MNIVAYNPDVNHLEKSQLTKSYAAGVTSIVVKNANRFANGQKILLGNMSRERSEIATVSGAPTATTITLAAATNFPHDSDDPVFVLEFDKVRIYRSTSGIGGSYSLLATIDIDVDNADDKTYYDDTGMMPTYYYELCYYDSVGSDESERTQPIAATGFTLLHVGSLITGVAKDVGDPEFFQFSIEQYLRWMNNVNNDLLTQAKRPYRFLKTSVPLDALEGETSAAFPDDLWKTNYFEVNDFAPAFQDVHQPKQVTPTEAANWIAQFTQPGDYINGIAIDDQNREVLFYPAARSDRIGAITCYYYKFFNQFTGMGDLVETPNTLIYEYALKREVYLIKADEDSKYMTRAMDADKRYNAEAMKLQREKNISAAGTTGMGADRKKYAQFGIRGYRQ